MNELIFLKGLINSTKSIYNPKHMQTKLRNKEK